MNNSFVCGKKPGIFPVFPNISQRPNHNRPLFSFQVHSIQHSFDYFHNLRILSIKNSDSETKLIKGCPRSAGTRFPGFPPLSALPTEPSGSRTGFLSGFGIL